MKVQLSCQVNPGEIQGKNYSLLPWLHSRDERVTGVLTVPCMVRDISDLLIGARILE